MPTLDFPDALFWLVLAGMVGYFLFNTVRRGGFKAAMFNARISRTVGVIEASSPKLVSQRLKVHELDREGQALVGVEVTSKTVGSWEMLPLVLSPDQAKALSALLREAAGSK